MGDRYITIKAKMLMIVLPVIITIISLLIWISYDRSSKIIEEQANSMLESSISNQAVQIDNWLDNNLNTLNTMKQSFDSTSYTNEEIKNILNQYQNYDSNFPEGLYVADLDGNVILADDSKLELTNALGAKWFEEGSTHVNVRYGTPHENESGNNIISATGLIVNGESPVAVFGADVTLNKISIIVNSLIDMDGAEAFLIDKSNGIVLASSDALKVSSKLDTDNPDVFYKKIAEKLDNGDYEKQVIENNIVQVKDIENTTWVLVSYVQKATVFAEIYSLRNYMIAIGAAALIFLIMVIYKAVGKIISPVNELSEKIVQMSKGDFSIEVNAESNDEIGVMSDSLKNFIESMRSMLNEIKTVSVEEDSQAKESLYISKELFDSSKLQAESMKNLNTVVEELANSTGEIANTATSLAMVVADASENGTKVNEKMKQSVLMSEEGKRDMEQVGSAVKTIQSSIEDLENLIEKVGSASKEINNIIAIIGEIANSTNLLALNASIEAARAGDAGKGFAVVAEEIGSLANESSSSVRNIADLIHNINDHIKNVVDKVHESVDHVNESAELINNSVVTFDSIYTIINDSDKLVKEMIEQVKDVNDAADNMASISEEQAAGAEEISSTSQEILELARNITDSSNNVAEQAESLSLTAKKLGNEVDKFKL